MCVCIPSQDDVDLKDAGLRQGMQLMLIGSAEAAPAAPAEKVVFLEDVVSQAGGSSSTTVCR